MYQAEKVKIDVAMVEKYMAMHKLTKREFSQKMGHSHNWWHGVVRFGGYVTPNKAKLICTVLGMDYNNLAITKPVQMKKEQKSILEEDETLLKALVNCLNRIEKKVDEATIDMTRMEIQMRTILKELGVK